MIDKHVIIDSLVESSRATVESAFHAGLEFNTSDPMSLAYIIKGFWETTHLTKLNVSECAEIQDSGESGLMQRLIDLAALDDKFYAGLNVEQVCFVWCYEISEPFGEQLALHLASNSELPDDAHAMRMLQSIYETATASMEN